MVLIWWANRNQASVVFHFQDRIYALRTLFFQEVGLKNQLIFKNWFLIFFKSLNQKPLFFFDITINESH